MTYRNAPVTRASRGVTLIEVLISVALMSILTATVIFGTGAVRSARLKRSAVMVASAVRIAYGHASAISKPVRLVFDFEARTVTLEEGSSQLFLVKGDRAGGAAAANDMERAAHEAAESIAKGPQAPRPSFQPTKAFGFDVKAEQPGKELAEGIRFLAVETSHHEEPEQTDRAYLYFWPGGQTEHAAIQLVRSDAETEDDASVMTLLVSPLTGKTSLKRGKASIPRPRDEGEESEREDTGL